VAEEVGRPFDQAWHKKGERNQCPCRKCLGNLQSFVPLHKASAACILANGRAPGSFDPSWVSACSQTLLQSKRGPNQQEQQQQH